MSPTALDNSNGPIVETALATVRLRSDGMMQVVIKRGATADEDSVRDTVRVVEDLVGPGRRVGVLVDIRDRHRSEASARRYAAGPDPTRVAERIALLVLSPVSRMVGNAFLLGAKPMTPTRLFSSEEDAVAWLKQA